MRTLSPAEMLQAWETGWAQSPPQRALTLLSAACPGQSPDQLAQLSIGQRDAILLGLREQTFGSTMSCIGLCSECGERMEFDLQTWQIRAEQTIRKDVVTITKGEFELVVRPPNSLDLLAISNDQDATSAQRRLLQRCLISAKCGSHSMNAENLPAEVVDAAEDALEDADPQANAQLDVACPSCGSAQSQALDIGSYLWSEINVWARNLLYEVHKLASAYGWNEKDILMLSARRRRFYLNLIYS